MKLRSCSNHCNRLWDILFTYMMFWKGQYFYYCINMPFFSWSILFTDLTYFVWQFLFKLRIRNKQVINKLFNNRFYIWSICDFVDKIESLLLDNEIMIFETINYCLLVSLYCIVININNFYQLLQSYVSNIIFLVCQKSTENVYS